MALAGTCGAKDEGQHQKDKRKRIQDKEDLKLLEDSYDVKFSELKNILVDKLYSVLGGKTSLPQVLSIDHGFLSIEVK